MNILIYSGFKLVFVLVFKVKAENYHCYKEIGGNPQNGNYKKSQQIPRNKTQVKQDDIAFLVLTNFL